MTPIRKIQAYQEALALPIGHIERDKTRKALKEEYSCHELEQFWVKKFKKHRINWESEGELLSFYNNLCDELDQDPVKDVVFYSKTLIKGADGCYYRNKKTIHFLHIGWFSTVIHELGHHFTPRRYESHGKEFMETLSILYQVVYVKVVGKEPKSYWVKQAQDIINSIDNPNK